MQKIRNVPCIDFLLKLKASFGAHFGSLITQKLQDFKPLCYCNFIQKTWKFYALATEYGQYLKNVNLGPFLAPFVPTTSKQSYSKKNKKKIIWINLNSLCSVTSCEKLEKFLVFSNTWWSIFGSILSLFRPKKPQNKILPPNNCSGHF